MSTVAHSLSEVNKSLEFLKVVLPSKGKYCIAYQHPTNRNPDSGLPLLIQRYFDDLREAVEFVDSTKDTYSHYFCLASLSGKIRKQENCTHLKSLWLDIDVSPCGKKDYTNQADAVRGLKRLVTTYKLPKPMVVSSGRGLHVYFPFTRECDVSEWLGISALWKSFVSGVVKSDEPIFNHGDLKLLDLPQQLLRPVGAVHSKFNKADNTFSSKLPVKLLTDKFELSEPEYLFGLLGNIVSSNGWNVVTKRKAVVEESMTDSTASMSLVYDRCPTLSNFRKIGGAVGYFSRAAWASIIKQCFDGEMFSQDMEHLDPHPEIVAAQTEMFLTTSITQHAHTCQSFAEVNGSKCDGCLYAGHITSPIQLGEDWNVAPKRGVEVMGSCDLFRTAIETAGEALNQTEHSAALRISSYAIPVADVSSCHKGYNESRITIVREALRNLPPPSCSSLKKVSEICKSCTKNKKSAISN